jgi:hypothetical protein
LLRRSWLGKWIHYLQASEYLLVSDILRGILVLFLSHHDQVMIRVTLLAEGIVLKDANWGNLPVLHNQLPRPNYRLNELSKIIQTPLMLQLHGILCLWIFQLMLQ